MTTYSTYNSELEARLFYDLEKQNEKLHADMLTYRAQRDAASAEAAQAKRDLQKAIKALDDLVWFAPCNDEVQTSVWWRNARQVISANKQAK